LPSNKRTEKDIGLFRKWNKILHILQNYYILAEQLIVELCSVVGGGKQCLATANDDLFKCLKTATTNTCKKPIKTLSTVNINTTAAIKAGSALWVQ